MTREGEEIEPGTRRRSAPDDDPPGAEEFVVGHKEHLEEVEQLLDDLGELEATAADSEEAEHVRRTRRRALRALTTKPRTFGNVIRGFDRADAAEALLGSVLFGIPMLVEGGTFEVGDFIAVHPLYYAGTVLFGIGTVIGIIYVAEFQDVRIHEPLLGFVPRRLAGVLGIAFLTALGLATAWGRVDWSEPNVALAQVVVVAVPMAIGGALGDILPGS